MKIVDTAIKLIGVFGCLGIGFSVVQLIQQNNSTISVYGLADKVVTSNKAIVYINVQKEGTILSEINSQLTKDMPMVYELLRKQGFDDAEISDEGISIHDIHYDYRYSKDKLPESRYRVIHTIKVTTKKVEAAKKLDAVLGTLLNSNICISTSNQYLYDGDDDLRIQLIEEATKDAEKRAQKIATTTGSAILRLKSISTGKFNLLNGEEHVSDNRSWGVDGENSYKKRFRIIVNATYNKK